MVPNRAEYHIICVELLKFTVLSIFSAYSPKFSSPFNVVAFCHFTFEKFGTVLIGRDKWTTVMCTKVTLLFVKTNGPL